MDIQDQTKNVLLGMMKEDTGRHMLDSGGAYGRHFERNQKRDIESIPYGNLSFDIDEGTDKNRLEINLTVNLFPWLNERVLYAETLDKIFQNWKKENDREYTSHNEDIEDFLKHYFPDAKGIEGDNAPYSGASYGDETMAIISQDFQYTIFYLDEEDIEDSGLEGLEENEYCFLQLHGGCDIRGGYTEPKVFYTDSDNTLYRGDSVLIEADRTERADLPLEGQKEMFEQWQEDKWEREERGKWEYDGYEGMRNMSTGENIDSFPCGNDETRKGQEYVFVDNEGVGYCPLTGASMVMYS